jgi:hypothetical protein
VVLTVHLFTDFVRSYDGPIQYGEGTVAYYDRSARPEVGRVRDLVEQWIAAYPVAARAELVARMRRDGHSFDDAFAELFTFQLLKALGYELDLHPPLPGTSRRPDFFATHAAAQTIVEVARTDATSAQDREERKVHDRIEGDINAFSHPAFAFVLHELSGVPKSHPKRTALHRFLRHTLAGLDPDEVAARYASGEPIGESELLKTFEHEGLVLSVVPSPVAPHRRGKHGRSIVAGPIRVLRSDARESIRLAVKKKATRYGLLTHPYVVVVSCAATWGVGEHEVREAMFGPEKIFLFGGDDPRPIYDGDGAFMHRRKPTNTRVSAVLACRDLSPNSVGHADVRLIHHVSPKLRYSGPLETLFTLTPNNGKIEERAGSAEPLWKLFGLWEEWPWEPGSGRTMAWKKYPAP